jgi:hypothetical protein
MVADTTRLNVDHPDPTRSLRKVTVTKRLYIRYGDLEICNHLEVDEFSFSESASGISVTGKTKTARAATPGLFDMLTSATRRQTDTKRADPAATIDAEETS